MTPRTDAEQEHVSNLHNEQVCRVPPPDPYYVPAEFARQLERELAILRAASQAHMDRYIELVNSGDAGNWNPEQERHVINLRSALEFQEKGKAGPLVPVDEVERAWREGFIAGSQGEDTELNHFNNSRARRVVEGEEKV